MELVYWEKGVFNGGDMRGGGGLSCVKGGVDRRKMCHRNTLEAVWREKNVYVKL